MPARLDIAPCDPAAVLALQAQLSCSLPLAQILVRRGLADPSRARAWIASDEAHAATLFAGIDAAVQTILRHVHARTRITVHGDYDVDGVCATAVLVGALRDLGAQVDWLLPSRTEDGYGLQAATIERLQARGTQLLITADCAVTAAGPVAAARAAGLDVVVTDHHAPPADGVLPDAPLVHPALCGYPCPDLCAAGVAHKLVAVLMEAAGRDPARADDDLDLVALATVADCVPLVGENRRLVRAGLAALAATRRPGLRALMRVARANPSRLDARTIGFRLAPRLNAAGRLRRADAALELILTTDDGRASAIAEELDALNAERRHVEQRIRFAAEARVAELGERPAYVLAGDDWHPGVIGIVAARVAERHHRPTVLVAFDGDVGTGSGRSIPAYDLLAGFDAGAEHLLRHGGHKAAAGCTIERGRLDAFATAFAGHAAATLRPEDLVPTERVDAVVAGDELGLELAEELATLEPFGIANPAPALLVPAARLEDPTPMGEGKHLRFTVAAGGIRARAVAFGTTSLPTESAVDVAFDLEVNEYNGAVEPRLVLRRAQASEPPAITVPDAPASWADAVRAELAVAVRVPSATHRDALGDALGDAVRDRRGGGAAGVIAALVGCGGSVAVVAADVETRRRGFAGRVGGFTLTSWHDVTRGDAPVLVAADVVALDPPPDLAALHDLAAGGRRLHAAWGRDDVDFAMRVHAHLHALREPLARAYRVLREHGGDVTALAPDASLRHPVLVARMLRALAELGLVELDVGTLRAPIVVGAAHRDLSASATFAACECARSTGWLAAEHAVRVAA